MRIKRNCRVCNIEFDAIKSTQFYCSRKCFKRDYYVRLKDKQIAEKKLNRSPKYSCPHCDTEHELGFDPIRNVERYRDYICPFCGMPTSIVWTHRYDMTFQFNSEGRQQYIVSSAIVSTVNYQPRTAV